MTQYFNIEYPEEILELYDKLLSEYSNYTVLHQTGSNVTIDIVCMTGWAIERYAEERIQQDTPKTIGFL
jgi:hypothetical protein